MSREKDANGRCCPRFNPEPWDGKTHIWTNKPFIKDSIPQFLHIPLPPMVGRCMGRMWEAAQKAKAAPDIKDFLLLTYDPCPWKSEFYLAVTGEVPGAENVVLSGTFLSRVFDGPFRDIPKWIREMDNYAAGLGKKSGKNYFHYTTCPKCARAYGHNYVVAFAQVE
jgi:hypothetical protein